MIPGFMLYMEDLMAFTDQMSAEEMGLVMFALVHYIATGEEPEDLEGLPLTCYRILRNNISRGYARYQKKAEAGARGGRASKNNSASSKDESALSKNESASSKDDSALVTLSLSQSQNISQTQSQVVSLPPTRDEVREYAKTKNTTADPDRFFDYYEGRGWELRPGVPVKNWKSVFNIWIQNEAEKGQQKKKTVSAQQFPQRNYSDGEMSKFYTDLSAYAPAEDD